MTKLMVCTCSHQFQDVTYGTKMRVYNSRHPAGKTALVGWRCTVCGNTKESKGE